MPSSRIFWIGRCGPATKCPGAFSARRTAGITYFISPAHTLVFGHGNLAKVSKERGEIATMHKQNSEL